MHPVLFEFGKLTFYTYGLFVGLGYAIGVLFASKRAEKRGLNPDRLFWFFIVLLLAALFGGRIAYVLTNRWLYPDLKSVFQVGTGGLAVHGVLAGGLLVIIVYSKISRIPFLTLGDIVAPSVALGQAIGRIGCFFNGCCYGELTSGGWGVMTRFAPGLRHPVQLYESALDLLLFLGLVYFERNARAEGQVFSVYFIGYGVIRFVLDFFREQESFFLNVAYSQWASLALVVLGVALYLRSRSLAGRSR